MTTPTTNEDEADDGISAEARTLVILEGLDRLYDRLLAFGTSTEERGEIHRKIVYTIRWLRQNLDLKPLTDFIETTTLTYKTDILDLLRSNPSK